ncbi:hypothetical protein BDV96DRAFT_51154 [Lophiotrema nucula]|uniref:Uncharacterized protein n=1 Tax=Lophiotrema nucula TaxID=690887 RepID=A0A6A5ZCB4_9PLEO|nr:hypothetical protein BDV96DRAFT_51154 [Lophiotrema nucula]
MGQFLTTQASTDGGGRKTRGPPTKAISDLGEEVLKKIVRFAVVQSSPIVFQPGSRPPNDPFPGVAAFGPRIGGWAQELYFKENIFRFSYSMDLHDWAKAKPKHASLLRRVHIVQCVIPWDTKFLAKGVNFLTGLQELYLKIDELEMVSQQCKAKQGFREVELRPEDVDRQLNLLVLLNPGVAALRQFRVPKVSFILSGPDGPGAIPAGVLRTLVAKEMMTPLPNSLPKAPRKRKLVSTEGEDDDEYLPSGKASRTKRKRVGNKGASDHIAVGAKRTPPGCRLLELPAELRNRIYSYALQVDGKVNPSTRPAVTYIKPGRSRRAQSGPEACSALALLQTCKQINAEAFSFYYSENAFVFYYPLQVLTVLQFISNERKKYICDITIWTDSHKLGGVSITEAALMALTTLKNLKQLRVILEWKAVYRNTSGTFPGHDILKTLKHNGVRITLHSQEAEYAAFIATRDGYRLHHNDQTALAKVKNWQDGFGGT